jgi:hypothetical protein
MNETKLIAHTSQKQADIVYPLLADSSIFFRIVPIGLKEANKFIIKLHRHHKQVQGHKFSIGLEANGVLVGVAVCGRPVSRHLDTGYILEVTRLCTDGTKNACSKLYAACARVAREMGYEKIITYILESEKGASLKASGWKCDERGVGGLAWNSSGKNVRMDSIINLFGDVKKYPNELKQRWTKKLNFR